MQFWKILIKKYRVSGKILLKKLIHIFALVHFFKMRLQNRGLPTFWAKKGIPLVALDFDSLRNGHPSLMTGTGS